MHKLLQELNRKIDSLVEDYKDALNDLEKTQSYLAKGINKTEILGKIARILNELLPAHELVVKLHPSMEQPLYNLSNLNKEYFAQMQKFYIKEDDAS